MPRTGPHLSPEGHGRWALRFPRPPVRRLEYRFELSFPDGSRETICDAANPLRAPGAFGERSVVEFPDYRLPPFVGRAAPQGEVLEMSIPASTLGRDQPARLWSSHGGDPTGRLPMLVALDGIEFAAFSGLTHMLDWAVATRRVPPMRALLLHPTERNDHYSANPALAEALSGEILPAVHLTRPIADEPRWRAGLGASLGGLALLHSHRCRRDLFGALYLQSGTFIDRGHLGEMKHAGRIESFVEHLVAAPAWPAPIPVEMTCGAVETNLGCNKRVRSALRRQGYPARLHVMPDAHNWIAWRDGWAPHLPALLGKVWK